MNSIGTHYYEAESNTVSTVEYYGGDIRVLENEWDDGEVMVTQEMKEISGIGSQEELRRVFHEALTEMAVLESLDYNLDHCDDGVAFWSKTISE